MGTLDQIKQMRDQGISDEEIVVKLQEQRISPKEINDAMNQAKIKSAIVDTENMQPSIMNTPQTPNNNENVYIPQTQESRQENYAPQPQYSQQEYYPQEGYDEHSSSIGNDTDIMIEIAEQVFSEKMQKMSKDKGIKTLVIDSVNGGLKEV